MKSLKAKMMVATCAICIICLVITGVISYNTASSKLADAESQKATLLAEKSAEEIDNWLNNYASYLNVTASTLESKKITDFQEVSAYLKDLLENHNEGDVIYDIYFTYAENKMAAGSGYIADPEVDFTKRNWYLSAVEKEGVHYESSYKDADSGRYVITLSQKVTIDGKIVGVLAEDIFIDQVVDIVNQCNVSGDSYAMLIDQNQGLMVHPNEKYGYVEDEPVKITDLKGNPYEKLGKRLTSGKTGDTIWVKDYDNANRGIFTGTVKSCDWIVAIALEKSVLYQGAQALLLGFGIAMVVSLIIGIIIITIITRKVVEPIGVLENTITSRNISENVQVDTNDEVGRLAKGFNQMMNSLRGLLTTSEEAAGSIEESSRQLHNITKSIVDGAKQVNSKMENINGTMEVQYESVSTSREKLVGLDEEIGRFEKQFSYMQDAVISINNKLSENIEVIDQLGKTTISNIENMKALQENVSVLERKSSDITDIISTITNISGQTNLLALNASIEAARAGEAGRGFSVVADEIRQLSEQTESATEEIRELVTEIQEQVGSTVLNIQDYGTAFQSNIKIADQVQEAFSQIDSFIKNFDEINQNMSNELNAFVQAKNSMKESFEVIDANTNSCMQFSKEALSASDEQAKVSQALEQWSVNLQKQADELKEKTETFKK